MAALDGVIQIGGSFNPPNLENSNGSLNRTDRLTVIVLLISTSSFTTTTSVISTAVIYLLRASSGDRRDAFQAGYTPAIMLNESESNQTFTRSFGTKIGAK